MLPAEGFRQKKIKGKEKKLKGEEKRRKQKKRVGGNMVAIMVGGVR